MSTKSEQPTNIEAMRHSLAHIMAGAIQELWPKTKFGIGPVINNGFYYDVDLEQSLSPEDLKSIEKKMIEIIKADYPFELNLIVLIFGLHLLYGILDWQHSELKWIVSLNNFDHLLLDALQIFGR